MTKICEVCGKEYGGWHVFVRSIAGYSHVLTCIGNRKFICGDCLEKKGIHVQRKW